jgi:UDP-N-acetylmuramate dehydrogenase
MVKIQHNISLKPFNTFGIEANTRYFTTIQSIDEINAILQEFEPSKVPLLVLGGGSNLLLTRDFEGLVMHICLKGIEIIEKNEAFTKIKVAAGEEWDGFVAWAVKRGLGGIENLSLIPGKVGASPVQNIGAYGVEAKDTIETVEGINISTRKTFQIKGKDCKFGYRDSIFKQELKNQIIITSVIFKLNNLPTLITHYGNVEEELTHYAERNIDSVRKAIISIRERKLPDPKITGNAGSFFKNPIISSEQAEDIRREYPSVRLFKTGDDTYKVPAAWLIEQCKWKGYRSGDAGVHPNQALVLINYGSASGEEIYGLACKIQQSVLERFGIQLSMEVNLL